MLVGFAEHDVIGGLRSQHGVVTGFEATAAGDALRFQRSERRLECLDTGKMSPVGTGPRHQLEMPGKEESSALVLHDRRQRLDAVRQRALIGGSKPQADGGDVGGAQRGRKRVGKSGGIAHRRGHEIQPWRRAPRFDLSSSGRHCSRLPPQSGGLGAL